MANSAQRGRAVALAATLLAGTFLSLALTGLWARYMTPMLVVALPLATLAVIALSTICVWGLLLTIPMYYMARAILRGGSLWRICLPMLFMQAMLTTVNHVLSGLVGWRAGAWCALYELVLWGAPLLVVGPARVRVAFLECFGELKARLAAARDEGNPARPEGERSQDAAGHAQENQSAQENAHQPKE